MNGSPISIKISSVTMVGLAQAYRLRSRVISRVRPVPSGSSSHSQVPPPFRQSINLPGSTWATW